MDRHRFSPRMPIQAHDASPPTLCEMTGIEESASEKTNGPTLFSSRFSTTSTVTDRTARASPTFSRASTTPIATFTRVAFTSVSASQVVGADVMPKAVETALSTSVTIRRSDEPTIMIQFPPSPSGIPDAMGASQMMEFHHERTLMTPGAEAAAIALSILGAYDPRHGVPLKADFQTGALSLIIAATVYFQQHKHRQSTYPAEQNFNNTSSLHAPETAHIEPRSRSGHLTRSSSHTSLFSAATYSRPITVSTNRIISTHGVPAPPRPPNPFADSPRHKAYDVLAGRPRSTTLTNRESWIENPFHDPASERFDPFGELQMKARKERIQYMEKIRREAEAEAEAQKRDRIDLERGRSRRTSGVTVGGIGILDRSDRDVYL